MSGAAVMAMTLFQAAGIGDVAAVRRLVAGGADLEEPDELGAKPLHVAAMSGKLEVLKVLVELGADMEAKTDRGARPLHWAALSVKRRQSWCWWSWALT